MTAEFELKLDSIEAYESALNDEWLGGRAFVPGAPRKDAFSDCTLVIHGLDGKSSIALKATVLKPRGERYGIEGATVLIEEGQLDELRQFVEDVQVAETQSGPTSVAPSPALRLKELSMSEKLKLARTSPSLTERTVLERMLDRTGWDALLANPGITMPEIAKLARKGTVPRPLIERIVGNSRWSRNSTVRRALLSNPKLTRELAMRVLRLTPAAELKLVPKQTAYPSVVRAAARELLASPGSGS